MVDDALYMTGKTDWETPNWLFQRMNEEYGFTLDVCASFENRKVPNYFDEEADSLSQDWGDNICWMNPPYGRSIGLWVRKARQASEAGATVVCLVPVRTDTAWWQEEAWHADEIVFLRGRLKFVGAPSSAPFPSAILVFKPGAHEGDPHCTIANYKE